MIYLNNKKFVIAKYKYYNFFWFIIFIYTLKKKVTWYSLHCFGWKTSFLTILNIKPFKSTNLNGTFTSINYTYSD